MLLEPPETNHHQLGHQCGPGCNHDAHEPHDHGTVNFGEPGQDSNSFRTNGPDKLLSGLSWANNKAGVTLTYNFWDNMPSYYVSNAQEANGFRAFTSKMEETTLKVLDMVESFANITFAEASSQNDTQLGFAQASLPAGTGAWAYYPYSHPLGGDVWTNTRYVADSNMDDGEYGLYVMMHEIGHALGLQHSFSGGLTGAQDTEQYTVMAYDRSPWGSLYAESFQLYDIWALQNLYGANTTYNTGDNVYVLDGKSAYTIWDAGGNDTFDGSAQTRNLEISLKEGTFSSVGLTNNIAIAYNVTIENATGGSGNDIFDGNDADNIILGNAGNDFIYASDGDDVLDGGSGTDTVSYLEDVSEYLISLVDAFTVIVQNAISGLDRVLNTEKYQFANVEYSKEDLLAYDVGGDALSLVQIDAKWSRYTHTHKSYFSGRQELDNYDFGYNRGQYDILSVDRIDENKLDVVVTTTARTGGYVNFKAAESGSDITLSTVLRSFSTNFQGSENDDKFTVLGMYAHDKIYGGGGNDVLSAAAGHDLVYGGIGNDTIFGGDHNDRLYGEDGNDTIDGGSGNDLVYGGAGNDSISGGSGNDKLFGEDGNDTINGNDGHDYIVGALGNDIIDGGLGNDRLYGNEGNDTLNGGEGHDRLYSHDGDDTLNGGSGNDLLYGYEGDDVLDGGEGHDRLYAHDGDDTLNGGGGNDLLLGYDGDDKLHGGDGNDRIYAHAGNDLATGGAGNDILLGYDGDDILDGGDDHDRVYGHEGNNTLSGGSGNDRLYAGSGNDILNGGSGNDLLYAGHGDDVVMGGDGNDRLYAYNGNDIMDGGAGDDVVLGSRGNDTLSGGEGNDVVYGYHDDDILSGGNGNDKMAGHWGNDIINGDAGDDLLYGHNGNDVLNGGAGNDKLIAGHHNDILIGGEGKDYLQGDRGSDIFVLNVVDADIDYIRDFRTSGSEADILNISDILLGYDAATDDINDFVRFDDMTTRIATLSVNQDGSGDDWQESVQLAGNFTRTSIDELLTDGRLVADAPI